MADKSFGVKELNLLNASGTPTVTSPNNLNLNANTVAISTSATVGNNLTVTSTTNSANLNVTGVGTLTRAFATDLSVSGVTTITVPANANPHSSWDVVNNSASAYRFTGPGQDGAEDNPNIYLVRGQRYVFKMNASGHPFQIRVSNGGSAYSDGVTNNGSQTGNVVFNVQHDAPAQLFYQCTSHGSMVGNIYIVGQHLANGVDERVLTATSAYGMTGHSTLVYDGTDLRNTAGDIVSASGSAGSPSHRSSDGNTGMFFPSADKLAFSTGGFSRVVIDDNDGMIIGNNQARATTDSGVGGKLTVGSGSNTGITIRSGTSSVGSLYFSDGTSGDDELRGLVQYNHTSNYLRFFADASERLRITSGGNLMLRSASANYLVMGSSGDSGFGATISNNMNWIRGNQDNLQMNCATGGFVSFEAGGSEKLRITTGGYVNIGGQSTQTTHLLHLQGTGDAGIHIRADSDNSGENDNPYLSMSQDGSTAQELKIGQNGDAGQNFALSLANSPFIHANHSAAYPLQLAHMDTMCVFISSRHNELGLNNYSGTTTAGMEIQNRGNDTATALKLTGHNNTGTPGAETFTQLTHLGSNLTFEIMHAGDRAFHIGSTRRIRVPGVWGVNGSSMRTVQIESDGNLCAPSSIREAKINIESISDVSWLYDFNPVTFNFRTKTEVNGENVWGDKADDGGLQYGLIADEVEAVNQDLCFYDDNKLSGIHYDRMIAPLIKALQEQKAEIDALKTKVATLEGS